jgi:hypothetical protein
MHLAHVQYTVFRISSIIHHLQIFCEPYSLTVISFFGFWWPKVHLWLPSADAGMTMKHGLYTMSWFHSRPTDLVKTHCVVEKSIR